MRPLVFACVLGLAAGCTAIRPLDPIGATDAGRVDAGAGDAGLSPSDAGRDASLDASVDGGPDGGVVGDAGSDDASTDAFVTDAWMADANCQPEVCGGGDEDCDGTIDEAGAIGATTWYLDVDLDNYGTDASAVTSCTMPTTGTGRWVSRGGDCDDTNRQIGPNRGEQSCNGIDDDCDGIVDDGTTTCGTLCFAQHYLGHSYLFCSQTRSRADAATQCANISSHYHLVDIADAAENDFVHAQIASTGAQGWWIGLQEVPPGSMSYQWTDGSVATYFDWDVATGEPNHTGPFVRMRTTNGAWADIAVGMSFPYVCEAP